MKNSDKKKDEERGLKIATIGFLIMVSGVVIGYFDFIHDRVTTTIAWIGFFVIAAGIIINADIVAKKMKK